MGYRDPDPSGDCSDGRARSQIMSSILPNGTLNHHRSIFPGDRLYDLAS
jgi:hypothetical protein